MAKDTIEDLLASCRGKEAFSSPQLAKKVARRRQRKGRERGRMTSEPYHCRFCGSFHIGKPVKDIASEVRRKVRFKARHHTDASW